MSQHQLAQGHMHGDLETRDLDKANVPRLTALSPMDINDAINVVQLEGRVGKLETRTSALENQITNQQKTHSATVLRLNAEKQRQEMLLKKREQTIQELKSKMNNFEKASDAKGSKTMKLDNLRLAGRKSQKDNSLCSDTIIRISASQEERSNTTAPASNIEAAAVVKIGCVSILVGQKGDVHKAGAMAPSNTRDLTASTQSVNIASLKPRPQLPKKHKKKPKIKMKQVKITSPQSETQRSKQQAIDTASKKTRKSPQSEKGETLKPK